MSGATPGGPPRTRPWCQGTDGREHRPVIRLSGHVAETDIACTEVPAWWGFCFHDEECATCGVILQRNIPRDRCPDIAGT